eukprot:TRINITY_DN13549_c0_g3_i1.p1 TRINITY_DN13549_c0_g3~~TRINITY_DN13549_c0_g3_i1.p1  ORF type:complete len:1097 (-),score=293.80 TRINITY_DN13549_c0_g3_i1:124-3414(-)
MHPYGRSSGGSGYGQHQMGRPPPSYHHQQQQAPSWRPGVPSAAPGYGHQGQGYGAGQHGQSIPAAGRYGGPGGPGGRGMPPARPQIQMQSRGSGSGGGPKREMDSLLEEIKAKQKMQVERRDQITGDGSPEDSASQDMPGSRALMQQQMQQRASQASSYSSSGNSVGQNYGQPMMNLGGAPQYSSAPPPAVSGSRGMHAEGDLSLRELQSTLFLKELPSTATEDGLCQLFSRYGLVTGIDIVYGKESSSQLQGYVVMDSRDSAQRAKEALNDREVDGVPLWIEWTKVHAPQEDRYDPGQTGRHVIVQIPSDEKRRRTIDLLARCVAQEGHAFEQIIMERESPEGMFDFLHQPDTPDNVYYRWRTFAFAQRDNAKVWRTETFRMYEGGRWWRPPACEAAVEAAERKKNTKFGSGPKKEKVSEPLEPPPNPYNPATAARAQPGTAAVMPSHWSQDDIDEERERVRLEEKATQDRQKRDRTRVVSGGKRLTDEDWGQLEGLLRNVSSSRASIFECMVYCMDKCDFAVEIAECVTESLTIVETELPLKIARLMIVSDILHNTTSSRPAAWTYRREFEKSLPDIFEQFEISLSRQREISKLQAERVKDQALKMLRVWEDWGLFAPQFLKGLEASLCIGVRRLRALAAKGDNSREPAWLEPKLADWRRQHFSQLEKMCRTRGLRCNTGHLEPTKQQTLEEGRRDWLIDRLVAFEMLAHEKEQARQATVAKEAEEKAARRRARYGLEDYAGEDPGLDGWPLEEEDLDGIPMEFDSPGSIYSAIETAKKVLRAPEVSMLFDYYGNVGAAGSRDVLAVSEHDIAALAVLGAPPVIQSKKASTISKEDIDGVAVKSKTESARQSKAAHDDEEMLDIERPEDPSKLDFEANTAVEEETKSSTTASTIDHKLLRDIELEVMELRASLELKGTHRDVIEEQCDQKRKSMIEEHEAGLSAKKDGTSKKVQSSSTVKKDKEKEKEKERDRKKKEDEKNNHKEREKEKEKDSKSKVKDSRDKDKEKEKGGQSAKQDKDKDKDKEKARREREKEKEKEKAEREKAREKALRGKDSEKDKDKAKEKAKEKDKEKDVKKRSRSKSVDASKKKVRK